jgi:glycyl-tRNA synthetase
LTVDFDSLEKNTITIRDRDTMNQESISLDNIDKYFSDYYSDA